MNPESRLTEIVSALEGAGIPCLVMGGARRQILRPQPEYYPGK